MESLDVIEVLDVGTCRHCQRMILKVGRYWWHHDRSRLPALKRSCRAATGDHSLPKHWQAKP